MCAELCTENVRRNCAQKMCAELCTENVCAEFVHRNLCAEFVCAKIFLTKKFFYVKLNFFNIKNFYKFFYHYKIFLFNKYFFFFLKIFLCVKLKILNLCVCLCVHLCVQKVSKFDMSKIDQKWPNLTKIDKCRKMTKNDQICVPRTKVVHDWTTSRCVWRARVAKVARICIN